MSSTILPGPFLSVAGISKSFPGVHALTGVSLHVNEGEVLALIGENGAGKSTLMKIIGGIYQPDAGEIRVRGAPVAFRTVQDSLAAGIAIIHQELNLAENLSVAENIYLGRQPRKGPFGLRDRRALVRGSREALAEIGLQVHPLATLGDLSPGQKQLVEIAKALSREARLLVFDEPTSSLSTREAEVLFERIDELKRRGIAIDLHFAPPRRDHPPREAGPGAARWPHGRLPGGGREHARQHGAAHGGPRHLQVLRPRAEPGGRPEQGSSSR